MNFENLIQQFASNEITFDELVVQSTALNWGNRVSDDTDGSVDWVGENILADAYNTVVRGVLTVEQRDVLLDAIKKSSS